MRIEREIARILYSQVIMRKANRACRTGDYGGLAAMEFTSDHIAEMKRRVICGGDAFPGYLLRNNADLVRALRTRQSALMRKLANSRTFAQPLCALTPARSTARPNLVVTHG